MLNLRPEDILHKSQLNRLLIEIIDQPTLSQNLAFKGGSCASMLGYLDRFSVDLDFDVLKNLLASGVVDETKIRFFIGYSGWAPKQLDQEIDQNSWVITRLNPTQVMENRSLSSWKEALSRLGNKYKLWTNFPEKPDLN